MSSGKKISASQASAFGLRCYRNSAWMKSYLERFLSSSTPGGRCTFRLVTSPVVEDLLQRLGKLALTYFAFKYLVCRSLGYLNEMRCLCIWWDRWSALGNWMKAQNRGQVDSFIVTEWRMMLTDAESADATATQLVVIRTSITSPLSWKPFDEENREDLMTI